MTRNKSSFFQGDRYKWIILGVCFFMEFLCLGFCSSNAGLYTKAITEALEIKRSVYALTSSFRYVTQVFTALYFGSLVNRFGVKKMVCFGLSALTGSVFLRGLATNVIHLYLGGILWGCGIVFVGGNMAGTIVRRWFHQDVGRYTGIVMSANGIGGAIAAQIITPIINNGETFGYRKAYFLSTIISLIISIAVMIFLKESPDGKAPEKITKGKKQPKNAVWAGMPYDVIKRKPYFYVTAALVFLTGISLHSVGSINIVYMTDLGFSPSFIAAKATVASLCLTGTKILVGIAYDKKGLRFTLWTCQLFAVISFVIYATLAHSVTGMILSITASVLGTFASPLETVMIPLLTGDLFGSASYSKVLGIFVAMNSLGLCLGSPLGDLYFDLFGTYRPCFWFFGIMILLVIAGYYFVIRAARKDREAFLKASSEPESPYPETN